MIFPRDGAANRRARPSLERTSERKALAPSLILPLGGGWRYSFFAAEELFFCGGGNWRKSVLSLDTPGWGS